MDEFEKRTDETQDEYMLRIGIACHEHKLTWPQAVPYLNKADGSNFGECKYRKNFKSWKSGYDYAIEHRQNDELSNELQRIKIEQVKLRDERTAANRLYRDIARKESICDIIRNTVISYNNDDFLTVVPCKSCQNDLIVCLSDIHAGAGIDSAWNKYNDDIFKKRLGTYLGRVANIVGRHGAEKIHVLLLGDLINGHIHVNTRVQNNENSVEQIMNVAEHVSNFVGELHRSCFNIEVYSVSGNHSRIFPNKDDQVAGDELEALIPFYMKARLQHVEGINVHLDKLDSSFGGFKAKGNLVLYAHGDKDSPTNVVEHLTSMIKQPVDMIFLGHRHTNGLTTVHGTKVIESGCVCGTDSYAVGLRKNDVPQQIVAVINTNGLECLYDIKLEQPVEVAIQ